ncbi:hypothetical protein OOT00_01255 [Desulfobotulus sp. H1]|uniref:Uncharacterized protein n=1 Tax=Desulfobotulus pelophilus TaxID=2823377 RepID=A0ABT3N577_9BACT|nr:hypothetical protein [Desulfobotulus pelophilus]MCW7752608.1 hypothetical protein [Desulfobotulus pelophilus]
MADLTAFDAYGGSVWGEGKGDCTQLWSWAFCPWAHHGCNQEHKDMERSPEKGPFWKVDGLSRRYGRFASHRSVAGLLC